MTVDRTLELVETLKRAQGGSLMPHVLLRHRDAVRPVDIYRQSADSRVQKVVTTMEPGELTEMVKHSGLRGAVAQDSDRHQMVLH
jgi:hypothetical protein